MTVVKHELAAPKEKFLAGMALCSDAQWDEELGEAVGERPSVHSSTMPARLVLLA